MFEILSLFLLTQNNDWYLVGSQICFIIKALRFSLLVNKI